ncbi:MAG: substrate-binding domain-containing protein [Muribaculaceae bacterium]|nr:substrate-binding domain-containing protein [Muribaculaceae bacterium]
MKRLNSFLLIFLLPIMALMLLCSCENKGKRKYRIGVSQCSNDYWRVKTIEDLRRELLLTDEAELSVRMANSDNTTQIADIRYFIENGFDLIIVSPNESSAIAPVVKEAINKGIPVLTFDRMVEGDDFTAHIEVDNRALGNAVAKYGASILRMPIRVLEIQGPASASPAQLRHAGFTETMISKPEASIIESVYADWDGDKAYRLADSIIKVHPEINFVFAHTDHMAIKAAEALAANGRKDVKVVGIDGFPNIGLKAVKDSVIDATFIYSTEGDRIIHTSLDILNGRKYDRITKVNPLSPIDLSNADILISQDSLLTKETEKINLLRGKLDEYWERHSMQTWLLYSMIIILVLAAGVVALLLRAVISNRKHKEILLQKNNLLEDEKEKQKILYEQLQEATRSKLMFFTNVSHDLRTPLALISGPVEEIAKSEGLKPRERTLVKLAQKNISILRRLINQILDFRKYENGKSELKLQEVDLPRLLKDWTDSFREVARQRDIKLSFSYNGDAGQTLAIDPEKMERVFFNLMSNAFKHTLPNGKISVTACCEQDIFTFSVKDTGKGISPDDCAKIFDRFYQADTVSPKGSGIGLALTKAFIELHAGSISVDSTPGVGSEFKVAIPVRHSKEPAGQPLSTITANEIATELSVPEREEREFDASYPIVLVIDDNKDVRDMIGLLLGENYNMIFASDGYKGLRMAIKYVPDLIICDVMMPVMDGMECVKHLKKEITTSHIPVLMLTACSLEEQQKQGYDSGADGYLPKPFNNEVFLAQCNSLLLNRRRVMDNLGKQKTGGLEIKRDKAVSAPNTHDIESEFYNRFLNIVRERLSDSKLSVEEIASEMSLSQSQLTRKIKALTNYTPVEIIRNYRLKRAKRELETTEKSISEIAFEMGFSSLAYFSRCYKEAYGVPPTEARMGGR